MVGKSACLAACSWAFFCRSKGDGTAQCPGWLPRRWGREGRGFLEAPCRESGHGAGVTVAAALGHYTIPLKRDMQPTGVGRNLQICGDPGLCSLAVNMIYSKPFPDGTIKTRGSGFVSVSWSHWGAGRTGAGGVALAARASGTSCRGQPRPRLRAGLPRAPGMLGVGAAPTTGVFGAG